jgi:hypothetical protein
MAAIMEASIRSARAVFGVHAEDGVNSATLELIGQAGESIECELILMSEWKTEVLKKLGS